MNPTDDTGKLRCTVKEMIDVEYPNGQKFSDSELEKIIEALEE